MDDFLSLYNGAVFLIGMVNVTLILYLLIWETGMFEVKEVVLCRFSGKNITVTVLSGTFGCTVEENLIIRYCFMYSDNYS